MKFLKLYEQFDEWDPFGEESDYDESIDGSTVLVINGMGKGLIGEARFAYNDGISGPRFKIEIKIKKNDSSIPKWFYKNRDEIRRLTPEEEDNYKKTGWLW